MNVAALLPSFVSVNDGCGAVTFVTSGLGHKYLGGLGRNFERSAKSTVITRGLPVLNYHLQSFRKYWKRILRVDFQHI